MHEHVMKKLNVKNFATWIIKNMSIHTERVCVYIRNRQPDRETKNDSSHLCTLLNRTQLQKQERSKLSARRVASRFYSTASGSASNNKDFKSVDRVQLGSTHPASS